MPIFHIQNFMLEKTGKKTLVSGVNHTRPHGLALLSTSGEKGKGKGAVGNGDDGNSQLLNSWAVNSKSL